MERDSKQKARVARYRALAMAAERRSDAAYEQSQKMGSAIPLGQPILSANDRKFREKILSKVEQSAKLSDKAEYYAAKADAAENNNSIYLDDNDAIEKLSLKLDEVEALQQYMKETNQICRDRRMSDVEKYDELRSRGVEECLIPLALERKHVYAQFSLTNNNANIRRVKAQLEKAKEMKNSDPKEYFLNDDVKVVENYPENRLQVFFNGKPDEETRKELKSHGFRWSPSNGCWQSYLKRHYVQFLKEQFS